MSDYILGLSPTKGDEWGTFVVSLSTEPLFVGLRGPKYSLGPTGPLISARIVSEFNDIARYSKAGSSEAKKRAYLDSLLEGNTDPEYALAIKRMVAQAESCKEIPSWIPFNTCSFRSRKKWDSPLGVISEGAYQFDPTNGMLTLGDEPNYSLFGSPRASDLLYSGTLTALLDYAPEGHPIREIRLEDEINDL